MWAKPFLDNYHAFRAMLAKLCVLAAMHVEVWSRRARVKKTTLVSDVNHAVRVERFAV